MVEQLVISIGENNVSKFTAIIKKIDKVVLSNLRFDYDMNVLNLAIDQESVDIVNFLFEYYGQDEVVKFCLVHHKYAKGMQAIHQVMSLGHLELIRVVIKMGADL